MENRTATLLSEIHADFECSLMTLCNAGSPKPFRTQIQIARFYARTGMSAEAFALIASIKSQEILAYALTGIARIQIIHQDFEAAFQMVRAMPQTTTRNR